MAKHLFGRKIWLACGVVACLAINSSVAAAEKTAEKAKAPPPLSPELRQQIIEHFVLGNALFTLYHEMAHALIDQLKLPVIGREEDGADALATVLLLTHEMEQPDGKRISDPRVEMAAIGWAIFNQSYQDEVARSGGIDKSAFQDTHSLRPQRFHAVMCLIYGSNPQLYEQLAGNLDFPLDRGQECQAQFSETAGSWHKLLKSRFAKDDEDFSQKLKITYGAAKDKDMKAAADLIRQSGYLEESLKAFAGQVKLRRKLTVRFESCDAINAYYIPEKNKIQFCWELAREFLQIGRQLTASAKVTKSTTKPAGKPAAKP